VTSVRLFTKQQDLIYVPAGFAHGFLALTETVQFLYKCSDYYTPSDEYGILWNDPALAVEWGALSPVLCKKTPTIPSSPMSNDNLCHDTPPNETHDLADG